jgi:hypothetical protein
MILKYTYLHTEINIMIYNEQVHVVWTLSIILMSYNWSSMMWYAHIRKEADSDVNMKTNEVE